MLDAKSETLQRWVSVQESGISALCSDLLNLVGSVKLPLTLRQKAKDILSKLNSGWLPASARLAAPEPADWPEPDGGRACAAFAGCRCLHAVLEFFKTKLLRTSFLRMLAHFMYTACTLRLGNDGVITDKHYQIWCHCFSFWVSFLVQQRTTFNGA